MKLRVFLLLLALSLPKVICVKAQVDSVIVEKYYVSDNNDATDVAGGGLAAGSVTYRIFVDLVPGSKLLRIYGDSFHSIVFASTDYIFNNTDRGKSLGFEIRASRLDENTVALDSWITIGLASDIHSGIFKAEDNDGSVVGGLNNDGGSSGISGGLLVNADPAAGIPLTSADGLVPVLNPPQNWQYQLNGIIFSSATDTSIFGNLNLSKQFISNDFILSNSGVSGTSETNRILVAQITTKGELSFKLNISIEEIDGSGTKVVNYVAENPTGEEKTNRFLTYPTPPGIPLVCGCKDTDYLEYNKNFDCHIQDSCKNLIVIGCTDPLACNFDPNANFNVPEICCYPGRCKNRDIRVVCPGLQSKELGLMIFPNPANDRITMEISGGHGKGITCNIYDSNGTSVMTENIGIIDEILVYQLDISCIQKGYYLLRLYSYDQSITKPFIKN